MRQAWTALAAVVLLAGCTSEPEPTAGPSPTSPRADAPRTEQSPGPQGDTWRTEVWRDVQLEVPPHWRLGYAPLSEGAGARLCGTGPVDGSGKPYVGRPGYGSDVCIGVGLDELALTGEGVWFGSPLPEGEVASKNGLDQTTVAVGDSRVTVATYDEAVRERVLDSVKQVDEDVHGCPARPEVQRGWPVEGYGDSLSLAVCVYQRERSPERWHRLWTTSLPAARADRLVEAVEDAEPGPSCRTQESSQLVLLRISADDPMGDEPLLRDLLGRPSGCASLQAWGPGGGSWLALEPDLVRPWAVEGVRSHVWSNGLPRPVSRFFRPMWG